MYDIRGCPPESYTRIAYEPAGPETVTLPEPEPDAAPLTDVDTEPVPVPVTVKVTGASHLTVRVYASPCATGGTTTGAGVAVVFGVVLFGTVALGVVTGAGTGAG